MIEPTTYITFHVLRAVLGGILYAAGWTLGLLLRALLALGAGLVRAARSARHVGSAIRCPHHGCEEAADAWFECGVCHARTPDLWVWGPCPVCKVEPGYTVCRCGAAIPNPHLRS